MSKRDVMIAYPRCTPQHCTRHTYLQRDFGDVCSLICGNTTAREHGLWVEQRRVTGGALEELGQLHVVDCADIGRVVPLLQQPPIVAGDGICRCCTSGR